MWGMLLTQILEEDRAIHYSEKDDIFVQLVTDLELPIGVGGQWAPRRFRCLECASVSLRSSRLVRED